ncbi:MAG: TetR/AcrR family transcriptional regulator, partial [Chakrabartia sp.]
MAKGDFHKNLAKQKRSQICDAAIQLFLRQGFEITTMNEISATANVSIMTLYKNFKSKDELFKFVIDDLFDKVSSALKMSIDLDMDVKPALSLFLRNYCYALIDPSTVE